jgi:hypothetical protein
VQETPAALEAISPERGNIQVNMPPVHEEPALYQGQKSSVKVRMVNVC